jgi:hypothetical protein
MFRAPLQIGLPNADHAIAARGHIGVLRNIEGHASALALRRSGELVGVPVPVVTIKLNDEFSKREGVNTEAPAYQVLSLVWNGEVVQQRISRLLKRVRAQGSLLDVHLNQSRTLLGVCIAAICRAIGWSALTLVRGRFAKLLAASLAAKRALVPTLPFVCMVGRTKEIGRLFQARSVQVDGGTADSARPLLAGFPRRFCARSIAVNRAEALAGLHPPCNGQPAADTRDGPHLVSEDSAHVRSIA